MGALVTVLVVVLISLLVTRVATIALVLTGLSRESARFQARSAFSGIGFTTSESEAVVAHPVRRRIVLALMLVGSAGIVGVIASLAASFAGKSGTQAALRAGVLILGLILLWRVSRSAWVDRRLSAVIERVLRRYTDLDVRDYARLLHLHGDYAVTELAVEDGDWIAGRPLESLRLRDEGVVVLGIQRVDGTFIGAPHGEDTARPGDTLVVYGRDGRVCELDARAGGAAGEDAHREAVREQRALEDEGIVR
jgi:hypothetical protein